jgi:hypothetical protein
MAALAWSLRAASNPAIALWLQSTRLVAGVAEDGALGVAGTRHRFTFTAGLGDYS